MSAVVLNKVQYIQSYFSPPESPAKENVELEAQLPKASFIRVNQAAWKNFTKAQQSAHAKKLSGAFDEMEAQSASTLKGRATQLLTHGKLYLQYLSNFPDLKEARSTLKARVISLSYRIQSSQANREEPLDGQAFVKFRDAVQNSKRTHPVVSQLEEPSHELTKEDFEKLTILSQHYPAAANLISEDASFAANFVNSVLVRGISPDIFVQFINTTTRLSSFAICRFGHFQEFLKIENDGVKHWQKKLTIPYIDHQKTPKRINLLDSKAVMMLEGGLTVNISKFLKIIKEKPVQMGPLEVFPEGVRSFHIGKFGWSQADGHVELIDLSQKDWYTHLPAWQRITTEQANEKYGKYLHGEPLNGRNWMVALVASAKDKSRQDVTGVHGYQVILIPQGDGTYHVFPVGRIPRISPDLRSKWEMINFIANTTEGEIQYDTNFFTDNRVHGMICYSLTPASGQDYMNEVIAPDIQAGRERTLPFQFADQNCTEWVISRWQKHQEKHPLPYPIPGHRISLLKTKPSNPALQWLVRTASKLVKIFRKIFLNGIILLLGGRRGLIDGKKVFHSLWTSKNFSSKTNYSIFSPVPFFEYSGSPVEGKPCPMHQSNPEHCCIRLTTHLNI